MNVNIDFYNIENNPILVDKCEDLAYSQHIDNGGNLIYRGLVKGGASDYLVCALDESNKVVGFLALADNFYGENDMYVMQIVVDKRYLRKGIASRMIDCAIIHSKGYDFFMADVRKDNIESNCLFSSKGCIKKEKEFQNLYLFDLKSIKNREKIKEKNLFKR